MKYVRPVLRYNDGWFAGEIALEVDVMYAKDSPRAYEFTITDMNDKSVKLCLADYQVRDLGRALLETLDAVENYEEGEDE